MFRFARIMGTSAGSRVRIDRDARDRLGRARVHLSGSLHPEDLRGREMLGAAASD